MIPRIDTHLHLWDPARFPCSWCAGLPVLNRAFGSEDYLAAAAHANVSRAVFVECDVDEPWAAAEARWVQELTRREPWIAGLVASARPERPDFPAQLEELLPLSSLRGIRRVLHVVPDETSATRTFADNVRRLAAHGLTFDLCVLARQLPRALDLARRCPDVQFVLDHCGVPDVKAGAGEPWRSDLRRLAELPHVACKVSGLPAYAAAGWTPTDLRPWVEHAVDCFGWQRLMWGGDWPVCTLNGTLGRWVEATDAIFAGVSPAERALLFHGNAARLYRLEPGPP